MFVSFKKGGVEVIRFAGPRGRVGGVGPAPPSSGSPSEVDGKGLFLVMFWAISNKTNHAKQPSFSHRPKNNVKPALHVASKKTYNARGSLSFGIEKIKNEKPAFKM